MRNFMLAQRTQLDQNGDAMKTLLRTNKYIVAMLGIVGCVVILSCAQHQQGSGSAGKVVITKTGIIIHPTIKLSAMDEQAMNNVLKKYKKSLYRIETLNKGKMVRTEGKANIVAALKPEIARAQSQGADDETGNSVCPASPGCGTNQFTSKDLKLIEDLKAILQKYQ